MAKKVRTIAQEINRELATPKNKDYDIEDDERRVFQGSDDDENSDSEDEEEENLKIQHYVKSSKSKLRDTTINLGDKYVGAKTSRAELFDDEAEVSGEEVSKDEDEEDEDEEEEEEMDSEEGDFIDDGEEEEVSDVLADVTDSEDEEQDSNSTSESEESDNNEEEEDYKRSKLNKLLLEEKKHIISRLSTSAKSDALKGYSILNQYKLFDKVLDSRIKLQKAVTSSNQLPIDNESYNKFGKKTTGDKLIEATDLLNNLLEKVLDIRAKLYNKEQIVKNEVSVNTKKRRLDTYSNETNKLDDILQAYKKNVLVKWSNKVSAASGSNALNQGKFKTINQNVYTQVENNLQDLDRLIKRTKLNRRNVTPLGYNDSQIKRNANDKDSENDDDEELNSEDEEERKYQSKIDRSLQTNEYIFDDDDFYRVLLNDMVDKKISDKQSSSTSTIITLTKTNKIHKNYDRKATKGRKLKYTVQEQLQHFEAPKYKYYHWNDDQIDELFASLLGQKVNMNEENERESDEDDQDGYEEQVAIKKSGLKLFG